MLQVKAVSKLPDRVDVPAVSQVWWTRASTHTSPHRLTVCQNCTTVPAGHGSKPWPGYWPDCLPGYDLHVVRCRSCDSLTDPFTRSLTHSLTRSLIHTHTLLAAMSCKGRVALCHVFLTESPRKSYELTFTCAQAFDHNYKIWQANKSVAKMKAQVSETGDIGATLCVCV